MLRSGGASLQGQAHDQNEDSFRVEEAPGLFVVSDGLGGHRGGATASRIVVDQCVRAMGDHPEAPVSNASLREAALAACGELHREGQADRELRSMAATLTLLRIVDDEAWIAHVGDSRAYRLRDGVLSQLTEDHTLAFEQYRIGALTKDEVRTHPNQRLLTRSLSATKTSVLVDVQREACAPGDRFLLCTDGVSKALGDEDLRALLAEGGAPQDASTRIVEEAWRSDPEDDITAVVVDRLAP